MIIDIGPHLSDTIQFILALFVIGWIIKGLLK
jgi:hypothetical protein